VISEMGFAATSSSSGTSSATRATPHPCRSRSWVRGGMLRRVLPAYRRSRPHPLRPALRTFLESGPKADADIDMDFDERRRGEMIRYVAERYGADHVPRSSPSPRSRPRAVRDGPGCWAFPSPWGQDREGDAASGHGSRHAAAGLSRARGGHEDGYVAAAELREMYGRTRTRSS